MKSHEVSRDKNAVLVAATAGTRAGILTACLQGMFEGAKPSYSGAEQNERPFANEGADFAALLAAVLEAAIASSVAHKEAYSDVQFTLITDKNATGSFIGRAATLGVALGKVSREGLAVEKDDNGMWETAVAISTK